MTAFDFFRSCSNILSSRIGSSESDASAIKYTGLDSPLISENFPVLLLILFVRISNLPLIIAEPNIIFCPLI